MDSLGDCFVPLYLLKVVFLDKRCGRQVPPGPKRPYKSNGRRTRFPKEPEQLPGYKPASCKDGPFGNGEVRASHLSTVTAESFVVSVPSGAAAPRSGLPFTWRL